MSRQEVLRTRLLALGFDDVRFVRLEGAPGSALQDWLAGGLHADMHWMERTAGKRLDPQQVLPGAKSAVLLGVNYWPGAAGVTGPSQPVWARYALYSDYHDTIKPALAAAGDELTTFFGASDSQHRYYVDTGPVIERGWAARAGLGFIGKNGMLISRGYGNWLFLAAVLTTLELEPDPPLKTAVGVGGDGGSGLLCGRCTRCLDACPTQAIVRPGVVDARLCISYQTIENKGIIPRELRKKIGAHIYGCDVCLEVCPWNRFARESRQVLLQARGEIAQLSLQDLLGLSPSRFAEIFRGTAIKRVKLVGLLRNACIVAANTGANDCIELLVRLASHESALVRLHAVWAVFAIEGRARAELLLAAARAAEGVAEVQEEYDWWARSS